MHPLGRQINGWAITALLLITIIVSGVVSIWLRYDRGQSVELSTAAETVTTGRIYVGGAVKVPGFYPLRAGDSFDDLLRAAGGLQEGADTSRLELRVGVAGNGTAQRININAAEVWLLTALPGIGEVRAEAIVAYRQAYGLFQDTDEITAVDGIGRALYGEIRDLITVAE